VCVVTSSPYWGAARRHFSLSSARLLALIILLKTILKNDFSLVVVFCVAGFIENEVCNLRTAGTGTRGIYRGSDREEDGESLGMRILKPEA